MCLELEPHIYIAKIIFTSPEIVDASFLFMMKGLPINFSYTFLHDHHLETIQ